MFMTPTQALSQDAREYAREIKDTWQEADFEKASQSPAAALGLIV